VVMPVVAVGTAVLFDLTRMVEVALIALALSPVPPMLPRKAAKASGTSSYMLGLLFAASLLSVAYVPLAAHLLGRIFHRPFHVDAFVIGRIIAVSVLLPLLAGFMLRLWLPSLAERLPRPLSAVAMVLLALAAAPILVKEWPQVTALVSNLGIVVIAGFVIVGLGVGHLLGGPDPDERTALALATASRHPAIALAILHEAPDPGAALAAVLLVLLAGAILSVPYVMWRSVGHAKTHAPGEGRA